MTFRSSKGNTILTLPGPLDDDYVWQMIGAEYGCKRGSPMSFIIGMLRGLTLSEGGDLKSIEVDGLTMHSLYNAVRGEFIELDQFAKGENMMKVGKICNLMRTYWENEDMADVYLVGDIGACDFNPVRWNPVSRTWTDLDFDQFYPEKNERIHEVVRDLDKDAERRFLSGIDPEGWSLRRQLGRLGELDIASVPIGQLALARTTAMAQTKIVCETAGTLQNS